MKEGDEWGDEDDCSRKDKRERETENERAEREAMIPLSDGRQVQREPRGPPTGEQRGKGGQKKGGG